MKTILIVDDEFDWADALRAALESEGYRTVVTNDPREALSRAREVRPALVITDLMMPYLSGYEITLAVKEEKTLGTTPVLLMSSVEPSARQSDFRWDDFLRKPFARQELLASVRELLGRETEPTPQRREELGP